MRICKLEINRWRNIRGLEVELPASGDFVCLVGQNGAGKSMVLEAINLACAGIGVANESSARRSRDLLSAVPFDFRVTFRVDKEMIQRVVEGTSDSNADSGRWDGTVVYRARGCVGGNESPYQNDPTQRQSMSSGNRHVTIGAYAGGVSDERRARDLADKLYNELRHDSRVLHLHVDAERTYPRVRIPVNEVYEANPQWADPQWVRSQASIPSESQYREWLRSLLSAQHAALREHWAAARKAADAGEMIPKPVDPAESYRRALPEILPHLRFCEIDTDQGALVYESSGDRVDFESLSGGEKELAFLVGQVERFGVTDGILSVDEPELHLNSELLRRWLEYLRESVESGQAWIATHSLEAVEAAGEESTLVLIREADGLVRHGRRLSEIPALSALAGAVGSPAFSLIAEPFVFIEGFRPNAEREIFSRLVGYEQRVQFLEAGGCHEVLRQLKHVRPFASETRQLRVGAILDRDFRTEDQIREIEADGDALVLPFHELENGFLHPNVVTVIARQQGVEVGGAELVGEIADAYAGRWILQRAAHLYEWDQSLRSAKKLAAALGWASFIDSNTHLEEIATAIESEQPDENANALKALMESRDQLSSVRNDDDYWKNCFGKECGRKMAARLEFRDFNAYTNAVAAAWRREAVERPSELLRISEFISGLATIGK